jgi:hypothetical protein
MVLKAVVQGNLACGLTSSTHSQAIGLGVYNCGVRDYHGMMSNKMFSIFLRARCPIPLGDTSLPVAHAVTDNAVVYCSLGRLHCFPPEILEMILGSLDVRTLCTARLVCKTLSSAASRCVRSIRVSAQYLRENPGTNFNSFPCLTQVAIPDVLLEDLPVLAQPAISHAVTDVNLKLLESAPMREAPRPTLPHLPNLRSMEIVRFGLDNDFCFPSTLQELFLWDTVSIRNGDPVLRLTGLTRLHVFVSDYGDELFEGLTTLTALQRLTVIGSEDILHCMGALPLLTHLDWSGSSHRRLPGDPPVDLAPLTHLQNLVHLGIRLDGTSQLDLDHIRTIRQIASLRSLELSAKPPGSPNLHKTLLKPLCRLTKLSLDQGCIGLGSLQGMNIEGLKDLTLWRAHQLGPEVPSVLQRATGLESLYFSWRGPGVGCVDAAQLFLALTQMSRLQSLTLAPGPLHHTVRGSCFGAIGLLTGLTSLHVSGNCVTDADVAACAGLKKLRRLTLLPNYFSPWGPVSVDAFLDVAMLPELSKLTMSKICGVWGISLVYNREEWFDAERRCRGWPPLDLDFPDPCSW